MELFLTGLKKSVGLYQQPYDGNHINSVGRVHLQLIVSSYLVARLSRDTKVES